MKEMENRKSRDRKRKRGQAGRSAAGILAALLLMGLCAGCGNQKQEDILSYRQVGLECMKNGDYDGAIAAFDGALGNSKGRIGQIQIDICYYKAAAQQASGDIQGAIDTCSALIDYRKKEADAYYMRGCLLLLNGDSAGAKEDFASAVKYKQNDYELYIGIYEHLAAAGLEEDGKKYLNDAFSIRGDQAEDFASRGKIYFLLGENGNAISELNTAVEKGSVEANLTLAQLYEAMGDSQMAESCYQTYTASGEADSAALGALARIEMDKMNFSGALTYLTQGLSLEEAENRREMMHDQIICMEYTGDFAGAWAVVQEYVQLYPDDLDAQREYVFLKNRQDGVSVPQPAEPETAGTEGTETQ